MKWQLLLENYLAGLIRLRKGENTREQEFTPWISTERAVHGRSRDTARVLTFDHIHNTRVWLYQSRYHSFFWISREMFQLSIDAYKITYYSLNNCLDYCMYTLGRRGPYIWNLGLHWQGSVWMLRSWNPKKNLRCFLYGEWKCDRQLYGKFYQSNRHQPPENWNPVKSLALNCVHNGHYAVGVSKPPRTSSSKTLLKFLRTSRSDVKTDVIYNREHLCNGKYVTVKFWSRGTSFIKRVVVAVSPLLSDPYYLPDGMPSTLGFENHVDFRDVITHQGRPPMSGRENDAIHYLQGNLAKATAPSLLTIFTPKSR